MNAQYTKQGNEVRSKNIDQIQNRKLFCIRSDLHMDIQPEDKRETFQVGARWSGTTATNINIVYFFCGSRIQFV